MPVRGQRRRVSATAATPLQVQQLIIDRHTPFAGAANIEQGIVINLSRLPSPGLAADHKTITVSPTQTWDQVYETLQAFDLATLGGRVAGVGVGGLATGCKRVCSWTRVSLLIILQVASHIFLLDMDLLATSSKISRYLEPLPQGSCGLTDMEIGSTRHWRHCQRQCR